MTASLRPDLPVHAPGAEGGSPVLPALPGVRSVSLSTTGVSSPVSGVDVENTEQ